MLRLDRPVPAGDRRGRIDHGEVELRLLRERSKSGARYGVGSGETTVDSERLAVHEPTRLPRRDTSTGAQPLLDHLRGKRRRELRHLVEQPCAPSASLQQLARRSATVPHLECGEQGDERSPRLLPRAIRNRLHGREPPRELGVCRRQVRRDPRDLPQRDWRWNDCWTSPRRSEAWPGWTRL